MKSTLVLCVSLILSLTLVAQSNGPSSEKIVEGYGQLPLAFEANQGQTDLQVNYLSRGAGYTLFLTSNEAVLALHEGSRRGTGVAYCETSDAASRSVGTE